MNVEFKELLGKTFTEVVVSDDMIKFRTVDGEEYQQYHDQDCCEYVYIESIVGEVEDLVGVPILKAEEVFSGQEPPEGKYHDDSWTWTFYHLATIKGYVTIRWFGSSNGYYGETASLDKVA